MTSKQAGWHPEDIKAALRKRFGPISHLSVAWGYHPSAISAAITGPGRASGVEMRIAEALGVTPHTLWPDRWTPDGALRRAPNPTRRRASPHRQIEGVA